MKPVAREVSSLLKSSSVWSPNPMGLSDNAREGGGSEPGSHNLVVRHAFELSDKSGADSWVILDDVSLFRC